ncbi:tyrosine-type recombinase/integrase [Metabacillus fastidiosus]|uniref:tyrosine-type recombinase/integrase n=1 Tax=Metabacillus fastidiosus TaxID=1458 RepID=UPI003D2BFAE2
MVADNVLLFRNDESEGDIVYQNIIRFLDKKGRKSERTRVSYEKHIGDFFKVMRNKDIEDLKIRDIQITLEDFEDFMQRMMDSKMIANKTINNITGTMRGLLQDLNLRTYNGKKLIEDVSYLYVKDSIPKLNETTNSYGSLTVSEVKQIAELVIKEEKFEATSKRLFILFCLDTCARKTAALNIEWSNFIVYDDHVEVRYTDKGGKEFKPKIKKEFYEELLQLKCESVEKVFNFSSTAADDMFKRALSKLDIDEGRNIVFHSIRKAGAKYLYSITGDILYVQKVLGHSSPKTTMVYIEVEEYGVIGAVSSTMNLDLDILNKISHEELLKVIKSCNSDMKLLLALQAKKILEK